MARTDINAPAAKKSVATPAGLSPVKRRLAIAAGVCIVVCIGFTGWWFASQGNDYQDVKAAPPPETSVLTIMNTTNQVATVKIKPVGEATPPAGFKDSHTASPLDAKLDPQQADQFIFSDAALPPGEAMVEVQVEATINGTPVSGTYTFKRKTRVYINLYDASGASTLDVGPGVTAK